MTVALSRSLLQEMRERASAASPAECCGMLLGDGLAITEARPAANVARDPRRRFEIDPQALVDVHRAARSGGLQVIGYYHSHPSGLAEPSATDRAEAAHDGSIWAIVGRDDILFWRDDERGFVPLSYVLEDS